MKDGDIIEQGTHEELLSKKVFMPICITVNLRNDPNLLLREP